MSFEKAIVDPNNKHEMEKRVVGFDITNYELGYLRGFLCQFLFSHNSAIFDKFSSSSSSSSSSPSSSSFSSSFALLLSSFRGYHTRHPINMSSWIRKCVNEVTSIHIICCFFLSSHCFNHFHLNFLQNDKNRRKKNLKWIPCKIKWWIAAHESMKKKFVEDLWTHTLSQGTPFLEKKNPS